MKVKIENKMYDSTKQPIMLVLGKEEKEHIANMELVDKYCSFPDEMSKYEADAFMKENFIEAECDDTEKERLTKQREVNRVRKKLSKNFCTLVDLKEIDDNFQVAINYRFVPSRWKSEPTEYDKKELSYDIHYKWEYICYSAKSYEDALFIIGLLYKFDCKTDLKLAQLKYEESIEILDGMVGMINTRIKE